jgi:hypothetical protein
MFCALGAFYFSSSGDIKRNLKKISWLIGFLPCYALITFLGSWKDHFGLFIAGGFFIGIILGSAYRCLPRQIKDSETSR